MLSGFKMRLKNFIAVLIPATVSAEVTTFKPGHLAEFLLNILGINLADLTASIPDMIILLLIIGLAYYIVKTVK